MYYTFFLKDHCYPEGCGKVDNRVLRRKASTVALWLKMARFIFATCAQVKLQHGGNVLSNLQASRFSTGCGYLATRNISTTGNHIELNIAVNSVVHVTPL